MCVRVINILLCTPVLFRNMCAAAATTDHSANQQGRAEGDGAGVQDRKGCGDWLEEQRFGGLRV